MNTAKPNPEELAAKLGMSVDELRSTLGLSPARQDPRPLVKNYVAEYLTLLTPRTRETYGLHYARLLRGVGPVCDQTCEGCTTRIRSAAGTAGNGRPIPVWDYVCNCECAACRSSRITIQPIGDRFVGADVFTARRVAELAAVAERYAVKTNLNRNRDRQAEGKQLLRGDGHNAAETAIAALRSLYAAALADELMSGDNPGLKVKKPRRNPKERRALRRWELAELVHFTASGGNDPELDQLIVETVLQTGARVEGVPALTIGALVSNAQMIVIKDKNNVSVEMPVSRDLIERLLAHAIGRGGECCDPSSRKYDPTSPVFYYRRRDGYQPITERRLDYISGRWQTGLEWARDERVGFHHLRHTIAALLAIHFGPQFKKRYLRHADTSVTDAYGKASEADFAEVMCQMFGFEHPVVHGLQQRERDTVRRLGIDDGSI